MQVHREGAQVTLGTSDPRITSVGRVLRKYKLDELPQLWNVVKGDMSLVGPRPEVAKYVALYTDEMREVLTVRPGLTDPASIAGLTKVSGSKRPMTRNSITEKSSYLRRWHSSWPTFVRPRLDQTFG